MALSIPQELLDNLALRFASHSQDIYGAANANSSPLYAYIAKQAADDTEILALVANADLATQVTNLLFGAVHFLLLEGIRHPLADFYPDLTQSPRPIVDSYRDFRIFCLEHVQEIERLVTQKRVQTNEVTRCSMLLPAFNLVYQRMNKKPLAIVEIGSSAGIHLIWDHFYYDYGLIGQVGNPDANVKLITDVRGNIRPPIPAQMLQVAYRIGSDIYPIDPNDDEATRWLRALIWPEHQDRLFQLEAALRDLRLKPVQVVAGNATETLPEILRNVPSDLNLCVFHSYAMVQMPKVIHEQILDHLLAFSIKRDFYRISQEWFSGQQHPQIELTTYHDGQAQTELLAYAESHGRWLEWLA